MPSIISLLKPISLDELKTRVSKQRAGAGTELCVLLRGRLYEEAATTVSIEAAADEAGSDHASGGSMGGGGSGRGDDGAGTTQRLIVRIDIPSRGKKLRQIASLLDELNLSVISGNVTSVGHVAKDLFHVKYRGTLSTSELADLLRTKLLESLQLLTLLPGDAVIATPEHLPFRIRPRSRFSSEDMGADVGADVGANGNGEVLLGLLDLRALGCMFATPANPDQELWLRYLQARAPDLLANLALASSHPVGGGGGGGGGGGRGGGGAGAGSASSAAERWLAELRGFMLLRWRRYIGGPQLLDGVQMRDLLIGPMLGEGAYGQVVPRPRSASLPSSCGSNNAP